MEIVQDELSIRTPGRGLFPIGREVAAVVKKAGLDVGQAHLFLLHTSAGLVITENADPDVHRDLETWMRKQAPDGSPDYRHDAEGPDDMAAHLRTVLTSTSLTIPLRAGALALGTWQGLYLYEHRTEPHERRIVVTITGDRGLR